MSPDELNAAVGEYPEILGSSWKIPNSDLQGMRIGSGWAPQFDTRVKTCSAIQRGGKTFSDYHTCAQLSLGAKLNFSDVWISVASRDFHHSTPYDYSFKIEYNVVATSAKYSWLPHCGRRYEFKMATVSFKSSTADGLQALFMPLDRHTWAGSGLSFTLIAILLTGYGLKNGNRTLTKGIEYFILSWQWILSSLSGQFHGTPAILRLVSNFPVFVIICILFYFLLGTVFYQGSMFSSLVALIPPRLPLTMESVVYSKIPIITTSRIYIGGSEAVSMLNYEMLDQVINSYVNSAKLFRTLTHLKTCPYQLRICHRSQYF
ncbi:hypothetical protein Fcan01_21979 [Folsomia candida]|uniref:Uncharacterized protein n=1 Tax=Folsomia candida TaxID=158441 RepID=A0A226DDY1_FOLCA|nr:hypothetical protein Fcan01_21979 [Folsomia candida]